MREIPGYEGRYLINKNGEIRSRKRRGIVMKQYKGKHGYMVIKLRKDDKSKLYKIATLVALTYLGERPEGMEVCHNNGISTDDRLVNLRYDTPRGNAMDRWKHGTMIYGKHHYRYKDGKYSKYKE
jgi:HNH endonuclease/NUMOD4 motif